MNSIDHTDGTLSERERERRKEMGRVREIQTDTGRYIDRDGVRCGRKAGKSGEEER